MNDKNNINDLLADVRYAYRLLFQFQSRILNLCQIIGNSYNMNYSGGYPKFSNAAPQGGRAKLDCWAWDWLNMYYYSFHFTGKSADGTALKFSVLLMADSGFFDAQADDACAIEHFASVNKSSSKLIFQLGLSDAWDAKPFDRDFTNAEEGAWLCNEKKIVFKHYLLEEFSDEDSTMKALSDFRKFAASHGFILQETQLFS